MLTKEHNECQIHLDTPDVVNPPIWCTLQDKTNAKDHLQLKTFLIGMFFSHRIPESLDSHRKGKDTPLWLTTSLIWDIWTVLMRWTPPIRCSLQDKANSSCFRLWCVRSLSEPLGGVKNLQVTDPTTNSLRVRWEPAEGDVRQYQIIYVPAAGGTESMVGFLLG